MNLIFILFIGLQLKHFAADFLFQNEWMIEGKGSLLSLGGYVHAAIHAVGTLIVLLLLGIEPQLLALLIVAEFVAHYVLDYAKVFYGDGYTIEETPRKYWAAIGVDQFLHQLTYVAIAFVIVRAGL